MARQSDWKIVERGWDAHVLGEAPNRFTDPVQAVKKLRVRTHVPSIAARAGFLGISSSRKILIPFFLVTTMGHVLQEPKTPGGKPVSDQWLEPFVIVDKDDRPVGTVEVSACV